MRHSRAAFMNYLVPMVVEQTNRGERAYDIFSRLLKERIRTPPPARALRAAKPRPRRRIG